ncbi:MAG TPA: 4Fe-4S binding protein, partial [Victivallales bacterium]|nr:4Fe-4S binding protein [Victivallales bacterium]
QIIFTKDHGAYESFPADEESLPTLSVAYAQKPAYKKILVAGGGISLAGKFSESAETFAFPNDRIYAEKAIEIISNELGYKKKYHNLSIPDQDVRAFLSQRKQSDLDLAFISLEGLEHPSASRLCSKEFMSTLKKSLSQGAVVIFAFQSGENFLGEESAFTGAILRKTILQNFAYLRIVAGENSFFIASNSLLPENTDEMLSNLNEAVANGTQLIPEFINTLYSEDRAKFAQEAYDEIERKIQTPLSSDSDPVLSFPSLLVFLKKSSTKPSVLLNLFQIRNFIFNVPLIISMATMIIFIARSRKVADKIQNLPKLLVFSSGFNGMTSVILLMYLFQVAIGSIYVWFGLVSSMFMLGIYLGNLIQSKIKNQLFHKNTAQFMMILSVNFVFVAILALSSEKIISTTAFAILFFLSGFINGFTFAAAASSCENDSTIQTPVASSLMLSDNSGAAMATLLSGLMIIPLSGVKNCILFLSLLSLGSMVLCAIIQYTGRMGIPIKKDQKRFILYILFCATFSSAVLYNIFNLQNYIFKTSSEKISETVLKRLSNHSRFEKIKIQNMGNDIFFYNVFSENGEFVGRIFNSADFAKKIRGHQGPVEIATFADTKRRLVAFEIIKHSETKEYLDEVLSEYSSLKGLRIDTTENLDDIDSVSGATHSSIAVKNSIFLAGEKFYSILDKQSKNISDIKSYQQYKVLLTVLIFLLISLYASFKLRARTRILILISSALFSGIIMNMQFSSKDVLNIILHPPHYSFYGILIIASVIIFGNFHCGWFCPFGAVQELIHIFVRKVFRRKTVYSAFYVGNFYLLKYILLSLIVIAGMFRGVSYATGFDPLITFFTLKPNLSASFIIGISALIISIFSPRLWCRVFCPSGAFLSLLSIISLLRKKLPQNIYTRCPFLLDNGKRFDCLNCGTCRNIPDMNKTTTVEPKSGIIKKFIYGALILLVFAYICINIFADSSKITDKVAKPGSKREKLFIEESDDPIPGQTRTADIRKIKTMIDENRLSKREAKYYRKDE